MRAFRLGLPSISDRIVAILPRIAQLVEHIQFACLVRVELECELTEAYILQAPVNDLQRGGLFGHEQDGLALAEEMSNEICDGLALAGAWGGR